MKLKKFAALAAAVCLTLPFSAGASAAESAGMEPFSVTFSKESRTAVIRNEDGAEVTLQNVLAVQEDSMSPGRTVIYAQSPAAYSADAASFAVVKADTSDFNRVQEARYRLYEYGSGRTRGTFTGEIVARGELLERGIVAMDNPSLEEKYYEMAPLHGSGVLELSAGKYTVSLSNTDLYGSGHKWEDTFPLTMVSGPDDPVLAKVVRTQPVSGEGTWEYLSNGSWRFRRDGGWYDAGWSRIDGKWYYFADGSGDGEHGLYEMVTGWVNALPSGVYRPDDYAGNGGYYYFQDDGSLKTGWVRREGDWYFLDGETRRYRTGWMKEGNSWYYLLPQGGKMHTGWLWENGKWSFRGDDGRMYSTGWRPVDPSSEGVVMLGNWGGFRYFRQDGAMAAGWQRIGEEWYYFSADGSRYNGWLLWGGEWYYLQSGRMLAGCKTPDGYTVGADGVWRGF